MRNYAYLHACRQYNLQKRLCRLTINIKTAHTKHKKTKGLHKLISLALNKELDMKNKWTNMQFEDIQQ